MNPSFIVYAPPGMFFPIIAPPSNFCKRFGAAVMRIRFLVRLRAGEGKKNAPRRPVCRTTGLFRVCVGLTPRLVRPSYLRKEEIESARKS